MAAVVAASLRDLARVHGVTVVTSIHQPSSQVFALFDKLLLLQAGEVLYDGPPVAVAARFGELGHPCPAGWNIADWLLDVVVQEKLSSADLRQLRDACAPREPLTVVSRDRAARAAAAAESMNGWLDEAAVLLLREWRLAKPHIEATYRPFVGSTAFLNVGMGLLGGTFFYRLGYEESDIFPRFTACFNGALISMFFPLLGAVGVVPSAETMLRKDLSAGAHRLSTWFLLNPTLALLPDACTILLNLSITFWMGGVADDVGAYVTYMLAIVLIIGMFQARDRL